MKKIILSPYADFSDMVEKMRVEHKKEMRKNLGDDVYAALMIHLEDIGVEKWHYLKQNSLYYVFALGLSKLLVRKSYIKTLVDIINKK